MKTRILLIAILLAIGLGNSQAQDNVFERLSKQKGITTVFISKSLLGMMPNMTTGGVNVKGLAGKLEQLEIYTSEGNKNASKLMKDEITALIKNKKYETLMTVKEGDENVNFYAYKEKDKFKDLIMFIEEEGESSIIRIIGNFTAEDIKGVMGQ